MLAKTQQRQKGGHCLGRGEIPGLTGAAPMFQCRHVWRFNRAFSSVGWSRTIPFVPLCPAL
jgi:hypothetical protein